MAFVDRKVEELRNIGVFSAQKVDDDVVAKIINMEEWLFYDLDVTTLESYLGILSQHAMYVQQEVNIADAREIELGKDFKVEALPQVLDSKIRSVEERWIFASTLSDGLRLKYELWQQAIIEATLKKKMSDPIIERVQILKKIYDERRQEGKNRSIHKHVDGK